MAEALSLFVLNAPQAFVAALAAHFAFDSGPRAIVVAVLVGGALLLIGVLAIAPETVSTFARAVFALSLIGPYFLVAPLAAWILAAKAQSSRRVALGLLVVAVAMVPLTFLLSFYASCYAGYECP